MGKTWRRFVGVSSSILLTIGSVSAQAPMNGTGGATGQQPQAVTPAERELQVLMNQLTQVSDALVKNMESPQSWRYQLQQAEVLVQIAARTTKTSERDNWLRMAIESYAAAAAQCPDNEPTGQQPLRLLPEYLVKYFPGSSVYMYAATKEIEGDYNRVMAKQGAAVAREHYRKRLLAFAEKYPHVPEAAGAICKAAELAETLGKKEEACRCYRSLAEMHSGKETGRKAREALARLGGLDGDLVELNLPLLYPRQSREMLASKSLHGKLVLVHFWSAASSDVAERFEALKRVTDRGVEVVFVNLDGDAAKAREFLAGRLTGGTHVYDPEGRKSPHLERLGIAKLPHTIAIGKDGTLTHHIVTPEQYESVAGVPSFAKRK